jgi:hypothetical protein
MKDKPNFTGPVWSMAAVDHVNADGKPYFTFSLNVASAPPKDQFPVLYLDLSKAGAQAAVSVVAAAYCAKTEIDVFLEDKSMRVAWIQASKPPK